MNPVIFSALLLAAIIYISFRIAPVEKEEHVHIHGAGQIGLLAALALFGVDYFTSYYYATGELMSALHPYGMQNDAWIAVVFIAIANAVFGILYMYSLGVFNEGGGSFAAAMRYLGPSLSLIVAVVLIQDYVFTIVVSSLSGVDQLLSLRNATGLPWYWHFIIGGAVVVATWYLTIRGRGESARVVFTMLSIFVLLTIIMVIGLVVAQRTGYPSFPYTQTEVAPPSIWDALYHMLTASMKGLVALSGLEAMSNGIQFVVDEDAGIVRWGKKHLSRLNALWNFYSGGSGIGRMVQTSFLFYGGLTTAILAYFSVHFNAYDSTAGRSLVGNLAFIGFGQVPGGIILYWTYQILAVILLASASMTAYQDLQAMTWRNVAIGEIPEIVVYRNPKGTFTRPVTAAAIASLVIVFLVHGDVSLAIPYYGVGVFLPIMAMGLAIRQHILKNATGRARRWGAFGAGAAATLSGIVFAGQIAGKWTEGGWVVLISLSVLILMAHAILISPVGYRAPQDIHRIIRDKSHVQGAVGNIVEWQSLRAQEYRYQLTFAVARFWELFGVRRPVRFEPPAGAGAYEEMLEHESDTFLDKYLADNAPKAPKLGGAPKEVSPGDKEGKEE